MTDYMLEMIVDGRGERMMLTTVPTSLVLRLYRVERTEDLIKVAEKVLV